MKDCDFGEILKNLPKNDGCMQYFCFHTLADVHRHDRISKSSPPFKKPACGLRKGRMNMSISFHWFARDELLPYSLTEINMLNTSQYH